MAQVSQMFTSGAGILDQPFLNLVNWETGKGFSQGGDMKTDKKIFTLPAF